MAAKLYRFLGQSFAFLGCPIEGSDGPVSRRRKKGNEGFQDEANAPGWLPEFGVKGTEGKTNFGIGIEST